jgi:hypothetical protein
MLGEWSLHATPGPDAFMAHLLCSIVFISPTFVLPLLH